MRTIKAMGFLLAVLMLSTIFLPVVDATSTRPPIQQTATVNYEKDSRIGWSDGYNIANSTEDFKNNFNQTISPFLTSNPDIRGLIVAPYFAPVIMNQTVDHRDISVAQYFKVRPEIVIDGVSEAWIRIPVLDLPDNATIRVRIGRIDTQQNVFNLSFTAFGTPTFTGSVAKIFDVTDSTANPYHDFKRDQSNHYNLTSSLYWNFTWVHCAFAMMPNEFYVAIIDISYWGNSAGNTAIAIAQDDLWADSLFKSWVWVNGTSYCIPTDLDMAMILTTGISNGITGLSVDTYLDNSTGARVHYNASIPFHQTLTLRYLELVIPIFYAHNYGSMLGLTVNVTIYSSSSDTTIIHQASRSETMTGTISPFLFDIDLLAHAGAVIDHLRVDLSAWTNNSLDFKLWAYQYYKASSNFILAQGFTDIYWYSGTNGITDYSKDYFIPFGTITQSATLWAWTNQTIIVIPVATPPTTSGIIETIKNFEYYLQVGNSTSAVIENTLRGLIEFALNIYLVLYTISPLAAFLLCPGLYFALEYLKNGGVGGGFFDFLFGIGASIFKIVLLVIDAMQYMAYFAIRAIYSFSLIIIYIVNVYGVISINAALFAYAKSGRMSDFTRVFRSGWKFVYGIIALLISLALIAISILGAVIPL